MRIALTDGTPFPQHGADRILHLGILTIVLPLVAAILSAIVREFLTLPQDAVLKSRKKVLAALLALRLRCFRNHRNL